MSHKPQNQEDELAGTEQPFVSHLIELRDRLIRCVLAIFVAVAVLAVYPGPGRLFDWLAAPLVANLPSGAAMIATSVISPVITPIKILLLAAFLLALPYILYQLWAFVAPGLYRHERKLVLPLVISSTVLFFAGVAFCYFFIFGHVFHFVQQFAPKSITAAPDIEAYLGFAINMFLVFGMAFEVPVAIIVLVRAGVLPVEKLREWRGYYLVGATAVAAVVTPADVISMVSLMVVLVVLYEVGILAARMFLKNTSPPEETPADNTEEGQA